MAKIPILDLQAQYQTIRDEARRAIDEVLESQQFVLGPAVEKFEREAAAYLGGKHAVGVASGSDALLLALMALGIGPGDGVIVPPFTFFATVSAITRLGATPLFADIDPESFLLDVKQVEALLTDGKKPVARIQAVLPVHLFGRIAPMAELAALAAAHSLHIVEDVAQAFGARAGAKAAGAIGDLGCFSFFPSKNLGGAGDGGLILTDRPELAEKLRLLRAHGESSKYRHELVGLNSRLDSIQAALLSVKLRRIDAWCEERIRRAGRYGELFRAAGLVGNGVRAVPAAGAGRAHVFNYYVVRVERRDELKEFLAGAGVQTEIYYPLPLHLQPCFAYLGGRKGDFPHAERAAGEALALPIYPELAAGQQEAVVEKIAAFYRR
ncbi:MAG TPA: DegT/DnrJ/EryC1/StrS family aminotransferase [Candidatus Binatia bacterium]